MDGYKQTVLRTASLDTKIIQLILLLASPVAAWATEQTIRSIDSDLTTRPFWLAVIAIQILWIMGYCAYSLPKWAGWHDGTSAQKLGIVSGVFSSACFGNVIYFGGLYGADLRQIYCFIGAVIGGFVGEKGLSMIADKYLNRIAP